MYFFLQKKYIILFFIMKELPAWVYVITAVGIALLANSVSAIWARGEESFSIWLLVLLITSPLVFISFGLTTSRLGVAISSGTIDSLLTITTIIVGLCFFQEWQRISSFQYLGILLAVSGIALMVFFPNPGN